MSWKDESNHGVKQTFLKLSILEIDILEGVALLITSRSTA